MKTSSNFLTFDIEEWYNANYDSIDLTKFSGKNTNLEVNVDRLLGICDQNDIKATCFVVGDIARNKPQIVKKIHRQGHEVASHSFNHNLVYEMTPGQFEDDLRISMDTLEQIIGEKVSGFRAPSWSVNLDTLSWFYPILNKYGILYSSSVFPGKTFLYGIPSFPQKIHRPVVDGKVMDVWEIPQTLVSFAGKSVGFSGGFYMRFFPSWFINSKMKSSNQKNKNVFVYLHPREIDPLAPKLKLPLLESMIHYWGVKGCEQKLIKVINANKQSFVRMKDYIHELKDK
jgi:polysaccharide deacetylase family protein (PEP-CTERM system associated)